MNRLVTLLLALCLGLPAVAAEAIRGERLERFAGYAVHYSTFNSTYLQPQIARQAELLRSKQQGVINLSILKDGKPQVAQVRGTLKALDGDAEPLQFHQISEQGAVYYVAQYPVTQQQVRVFDLDVTIGGLRHRFSFNQELFPAP